MSEPSAAISIGDTAVNAAATSAVRPSTKRRASTPLTTTVAVPRAAPASWATVSEVPNTVCTAARKRGYRGGKLAVATASPLVNSVSGSTKPRPSRTDPPTSRYQVASAPSDRSRATRST